MGQMRESDYRYYLEYLQGLDPERMEIKGTAKLQWLTFFFDGEESEFVIGPNGFWMTETTWWRFYNRKTGSIIWGEENVRLEVCILLRDKLDITIDKDIARTIAPDQIHKRDWGEFQEEYTKWHAEAEERKAQIKAKRDAAQKTDVAQHQQIWTALEKLTEHVDLLMCSRRLQLGSADVTGPAPHDH